MIDILQVCPLCGVRLFDGGSHNCRRPKEKTADKEEKEEKPLNPALEVWTKLSPISDGPRLVESNKTAEPPYIFTERPASKKNSGQTYGDWL